MKNIKEYLKSEDKDITLYHKNGEINISYLEVSSGYWWESTYDDNGNELTYKNSEGSWDESTYEDNGNRLTYKNSQGDWLESTYDENGNRLTYKTSDGYWGKSTYDDNGNELTFKSSEGVERGFDIEEMTIEEICKALGKTIKITK